MAASSPPTAFEAETNLNQIEIGEDDSETSCGESSIDSYTTSLSSSVFDFVYENGRRYASQRFSKTSEYLIPNDETEQSRLDLMHHLWYLLLRGSLHRAQIAEAIAKKEKTGEPFRVLDLGTGTGIWAIDFGDAYPSAEVIGVDLSPIQPDWVPPNVKFEVDNFENEWVFKHKFDYIHGRNLVGSVKDYPTLFKQIYANLVPGGIVEFKDNHVTGIYSEDSTFKPDSALSKYQNLLAEAGNIVKQPLDSYPRMRSYIEGAGFTEIDHYQGKLPVGSWPKTREMKQIGVVAQEIVQSGVESFGLAAFTRILGWEMKKAKDFCQEVLQDYNNKKIHKIYPIQVIVGIKPLTADD